MVFTGHRIPGDIQGGVRGCGVTSTGKVDPHVNHGLADVGDLLGPVVDVVHAKVDVPQLPKFIRMRHSVLRAVNTIRVKITEENIAQNYKA